MSVIKQMLQKYDIVTEADLVNALKEIFQEITLLGLYSGGFFNKAAFYGGTALRILYGLDRFSEDLDFTLLEKDELFNIEKYFPFIIDEFEAFGVSININKKIKQNSQSDIESAFLKNGTAIHTLNIHCNDMADLLDGIHSGKKLKIKLEVDTNPPLKFQVEPKTLLMPKTFNIISMTQPNLFAGKMHAILFRNWKTRVKGRDWYDLEWYVKQNVKLNLEHLQERMYENGDLDRAIVLNAAMLNQLLCSKIDTLDIEGVIKEVSHFIKDKSVFNFWSQEYFKLLASKIKVLA